MPAPRPIFSIRIFENVCWHCNQRLAQRLQQRAVGPLSRPETRPFSRSTLPRAPAITASPSQRLKPGYFLSNAIIGRVKSSAAAEAENSPSTSSPDGIHATADLPHRRHQAARRLAKAAAATAARSSSETPEDVSTKTMAATTDPSADAPKELPLDASAVLAGLAAQQPADSLKRKLSALLSLSKPRLTMLVVLTAMAPYALYPVPAFLSSSALDAPSLSPLTLLFLTTGTTLCSAAANALNMLYEPDTDARMSRTRARPLVRRLITTRAAVLFAIGCAATGIASLYFGVNPTVAFLGAANIVLYAGVYTPMKRLSAVNTWVGALVGGIPPLMGWAAAAGESATADGSWRELLFAIDGSSAGGWLLAGLLFAWQFPHFMALSWGVRAEYKAAGLRMLSWTNPARNARVALRYSLVFVPLCVALCAVGVTDWSFAVTSLPVNVWLLREAVRFWRLQGHHGSARGLFWASVWHLPVVMVLALFQKKGMWGRVWRSVVGEPLEDDEEWEYVDDDDVDG